MRKLLLIIVLCLPLSLMAQTVNSGDADVVLSGIGGTDKYVSTGAEITFNEPIAGFSVAGTDTIIVTSIKFGKKNDIGTEVASGVLNFVDNSISLSPGETYAFNKYVIKMTFSSGGKILVNYKK